VTPRFNLLITDLDNTLYDWVTFYSRAFTAMLDALVDRLGVPRTQLVEEFREVHQRYGNSEQPFAALDLPSVEAAFPGADRATIATELNEVFHVFNSARKEHLALYPDVYEGLWRLEAEGIELVGFTDASMVNAYYRLQLLGIVSRFRRLYVQEGVWNGHPDPQREEQLRPPADFVREVPRDEKKPDPRILLDICSREGYGPSQACYFGDSLARDMLMATNAGVAGIWARYGASHNPSHWSLLVEITHWTPDDVEREEQLRAAASDVEPDFVVDGFAEVLSVLDVPGLPAKP
jgi:FMN phosphatase YigB (HAD superfamily)